MATDCWALGPGEVPVALAEEADTLGDIAVTIDDDDEGVASLETALGEFDEETVGAGLLVPCTTSDMVPD